MTDEQVKETIAKLDNMLSQMDYDAWYSDAITLLRIARQEFAKKLAEAETQT